eukprot:CAMPEP_0174260026 /NCGR_PEP_ID=MMETSP0439-20130205/8777_1 /TAXON_ID=0 /ORGANISM="Stereomyxa ramosa, Strain Chinc5" /LENGTH=448 /DNA_ID=CAMNT_0015344153 /DNA_START=748 /DNA_END=2094 /DNA_ORIENTATION=-
MTDATDESDLSEKANPESQNDLGENKVKKGNKESGEDEETEEGSVSFALDEDDVVNVEEDFVRRVAGSHFSRFPELVSAPAPRKHRRPSFLQRNSKIGHIAHVQRWRGLWVDETEMIVSESEAVVWADKIFDTLSSALEEEPKKVYPFGMYVELKQTRVIPKDLIFSLFAKEGNPDYVFRMLDFDQNGVICRSDMRNCIKQIYTTRRNLSYTLIDNKNILGAATRFLSAIFWVLMAILILLLAGVDLFTQLIPLAGALLALSFMFGGALKNLLDGFILALIVRPFSVGDRINVNGDTMIVDNIELYITTAHTTDGRVIFLYNPELLQKKLFNFHRSFPYTLFTSLQVDFSTPVEKIATLQQEIQEYLSENSDVWLVKDWMMWYDKLENTKLVQINMWLPMVSLTWAQPGEYLRHQTILFVTIQSKCEELGISYRPPAQEVILMKGNHP